MEGYNFNPYLYLGVGTGLKLYFDKININSAIEVTPSLPLFASFRFYFANTSFTPYLAIDAGYSFMAGIDVTMFFYHPTFGFRFPIGEKTKMNVGLGYERQGAEKYSYSDSKTYIESLNINKGISF